MEAQSKKIDLEDHKLLFTFLKDFIKNPTHIGAVAPSSTILASKMLADLGLKPGDTVVEFGPGTGVFTKKIREQTLNYLGIERSVRFTQLLNGRFPDLTFVNGLAQEGHKYLTDLSMSPPKVIISGLPLAIWSGELQDDVISSLNSMMLPGSIFRMFQYVHSYPGPAAIRFRKKMSKLLGPQDRSRIILRNLPPAFILTWHRK